jgi:hypothetical protein
MSLRVVPQNRSNRECSVQSKERKWLKSVHKETAGRNQTQQDGGREKEFAH